MINYLKKEYSNFREKLFSPNVIDLKKILNEIKSDQILMGKVKKPKENLRNLFYVYDKTKYQLFEPPTDNDAELIDKIKKFNTTLNEEYFIDELIFCRIDYIYTLEDFFTKKILEVIYNVYTEKNAIDLMNEMCEETNLKKTNSENAKKKKMNKKLKKKVSGSNSKDEKDDSGNSNTSPENNIDINNTIISQSNISNEKNNIIDQKNDHEVILIINNNINNNNLMEIKPQNNNTASNAMTSKKMSWRKSTEGKIALIF